MKNKNILFEEFKFGKSGFILEQNQFKRLKTFAKQIFHSLPRWISNILRDMQELQPEANHVGTERRDVKKECCHPTSNRKVFTGRILV